MKFSFISPTILNLSRWKLNILVNSELCPSPMASREFGDSSSWMVSANDFAANVSKLPKYAASKFHKLN